ncbi:YceI family protein [Methylophaga sp. OBS4]|uniref:YceI family protein n=1 Tax=Methylophaga sp. OBS4 TaxID=2991935 RepID=UPI0022531097|nr:YceI family protein [Methylophaga sp. OBS4]MCX4186890.1 YceI family protein [Methylophaga sp. OBS4]
MRSIKPTVYVLLLIMLTALLAACAGRPAPDTETYTRDVLEPVPAKAPSGARYLVDTARSDIRIIIYPDGRFGHAHVISGAALRGEVILPRDHHHTWIDLAIRVDALQVDEPSWRMDESFESEMSERAITGTRKNMLSEQVLHATQYPEIHIRSNQATGPLWQPDIQAQITLAGKTRELTVPVSVHQTGDELEVTGRLQINQSEFGIEPFAALGGVLRVADKVLIRFRIYARRSR